MAEKEKVKVSIESYQAVIAFEEIVREYDVGMHSDPHVDAARDILLHRIAALEKRLDKG